MFPAFWIAQTRKIIGRMRQSNNAIDAAGRRWMMDHTGMVIPAPLR